MSRKAYGQQTSFVMLKWICYFSSQIWMTTALFCGTPTHQIMFSYTVYLNAISYFTLFTTYLSKQLMFSAITCLQGNRYSQDLVAQYANWPLWDANICSVGQNHGQAFMKYSLFKHMLLWTTITIIKLTFNKQ